MKFKIDFDNQDIFSIVATFIMIGVACALGLAIFISIAEILIAFASTGIGAIILAIVGYKIYKKHNSNPN